MGAIRVREVFRVIEIGSMINIKINEANLRSLTGEQIVELMDKLNKTIEVLNSVLEG